MTCKNIGPIIQSGSHLTVYQCNGGMGHCSLTDSGRKKTDGSMLAFCSSHCPGFVEDARPKLSIVMPMHRRRDSVEMTIMALKIYQADALEQCEIIVCDNEKEQSEHGRMIQGLMDHYSGSVRCKYITFRDVQGTAIGKQKAIEAATGNAILCIDSHVMLPPGAIRKLIDFYDANPTTNNLYQGPCWRSDLFDKDGKPTFNGTHLNPVWSTRMFGVWGVDKKAHEGEPYEIEATGMGLFSFRREAWVGFDSESKGFGVEEFTTHAKFKKRGDKTILLPWLTWWHLFGHVDTHTAGGENVDRIENYVRSSVQTGVPSIPSIKKHFTVDFNDMTPDEFDSMAAKIKGEYVQDEGGYLTCQHRGKPTGEMLNCNCGIDRTIYNCSKHGKCLKKKPVGKNVDDQMVGVTECCKCNDWSAEETKVASVSKSKPIRVGLWLPVWSCGGVERYHLDLARATSRRIHWEGYCLTPGAMTFPDMVDDLERLMPRASNISELAASCDVIIAWGITDLSTLDKFAGRLIVIQHGDDPVWSHGWFKAAIASTKHPVEVVAVSGTAAKLCEGITDLPITILNGGVDMNRIAPSQSRKTTRDALGIGPDEFAVGFVGRFSDEKHPLVTAKVVGQLGDGFRAVYHGSKIGGEVEFINQARDASGGRLSYADRSWHTGDVFNAIDCLIVSSHHEAGPLVAIEAWLCGVPLISTPVGIVREHRDWTFGIVEDPNNIEEFAQRIRSMRVPSETDWMYRYMGLFEIQRDARELFSASAAARRWESFLTSTDQPR